MKRNKALEVDFHTQEESEDEEEKIIDIGSDGDSLIDEEEVYGEYDNEPYAQDDYEGIEFDEAPFSTNGYEDQYNIDDEDEIPYDQQYPNAKALNPSKYEMADSNPIELPSRLDVMEV